MKISLRRVRDNAPYLGGGASSRAVESGVETPHAMSEECAWSMRCWSEASREREPYISEQRARSAHSTSEVLL